MYVYVKGVCKWLQNVDEQRGLQKRNSNRNMKIDDDYYEDDFDYEEDACDYKSYK
jgi:hypothetical protein